MLRFLSLTIENFGPYKNTQVIDFTSVDGVIITWGDNGRGKTTLLNVFRYALFGKIQGRHGKLKSLTEIVNKESYQEGNYGFKVILKMDNDGTFYELTRAYKARPGVTKPNHDEDYYEQVFLKADTSILSPKDREHVLKTIMPEEVARFFLFDGELLQEYEELLFEDTTAGEKIKKSIERILGVPVLTHGKSDIMEVFDEYEKQRAKAARNDENTKSLGASIEGLNIEIQSHKQEVERLEQQLMELTDERKDLEALLSKTEKIRSWIQDEENLRTILKISKDKKNELIAEIKVITKDIWKGMLLNRINTEISELDKNIKLLENKKEKKVVADTFINEMKKAYEELHCPICEQDIGGEYLSNLLNKIKTSENEFGGLNSEESQELLDMQTRVSSLRKLNVEDKKVELASKENNLSKLLVEIREYEEQLKETMKKIESYGEITQGLKETTELYSQCAIKIENTKKGIKEENNIIQELQDNLKGLNSKLDKITSGTGLSKAKMKKDLCQKIAAIFEDGVEEYRYKLKKDVEKDATELFIQISNDPDYVQLEINENYGLEIVHNTGTKVPNRSAGFEHIVALSLIGALHKNAPLRGPIIMDSPFGRLDPVHKEKITRALPTMAEQIILLAYTDEIDEQLARETIGNRLLREYRLVRKTSFNTEIE